PSSPRSLHDALPICNPAKPAASPTSTVGAKTPSQAVTASQPRDTPGRASESLVDDNVKADPEVEKIIAPYKTKVDELNTPTGKLDRKSTRLNSSHVA